jgi:hypothetical protein
VAENFSDNQSQVIQCHLCREFINCLLTNCPYCGAVVGALAVIPGPEINDARKEAILIKVMARALAAALLAVVMSFLEKYALASFLLLLIAEPIMLIRWWVKYRNIQTSDDRYETARHDVRAAAVLWCGVIVVWLGASVILSWRQMSR